VLPALKKKTTLIRAASGAVLSLAAVPFTPVGCRYCSLYLAADEEEIMANTMLVMIGIAVLSVGTG
jgi:hypothetical protein